MRSPTMLRRIGTSAVAGAALIAAGAVTLVLPALANHTTSGGSVTNGPDLIFTDCAAAQRTTSDASPHPTPAPTNSAGRNPQAAATGSGCTVQAPAGESYRLEVRFTINGIGVPDRVIQFEATTTDGSGGSLGSPGPSFAGTESPTATRQFCTTDAQGFCSVRVSAPADAEATVSVVATERTTREQATENVEFRDNDAYVGEVDETNRVVVKPANDDYTGFNCEGVGNDPTYSGTGGTAGSTSGAGGSNGCAPAAQNDTVTRAPSGTPGRPVQVTYQLLDYGVPATEGPLGLIESGEDPRPLTNRTVNLTLRRPSASGVGGAPATDYFFTDNCGPVTFPSGSTTPNAPDYRQCKFRNATPGAPAGLLVNRGQTIQATSDANGLITVTVAVERGASTDAIVADFDQDGTSQVQVVVRQFCRNGGAAPADDGCIDQPGTEDDSAGDPKNAPLNFNTINRPLNGTTISIRRFPPNESGTGDVLATTTSPISGPVGVSNPSGFNRTFRPITATTQPQPAPFNAPLRFAIYLQDQFGNLVRVPETDVEVRADNAIELRRDCVSGSFSGSACTNPAASNTNFNAAGPATAPSGAAANPVTGSTAQNRSTGSFYGPQGGATPDYRYEDPFTATGPGSVTITSTWQAPQTTFAGGTATSSPTTNPTATATATSGPTATATASPTVTATATASPTASATASPTVAPTTAAPSPTTAAPSPTTQSPSPTFTQPPQRFASRVTLLASHSRVTAGNGPRLNGQVLDQNGQPLGGVNVTIFEKSFGETQYDPTPRGQVTSGPDGRFSVVVNPVNQTSYGANTDDGRANSNIVQIRVNARMDITSHRHLSQVANPVTLSGQILPAYNNVLIGLAYIRPDGRYQFLGSAPTTNGRFTVRANAPVPRGTYTFVVYMSPTQGTDRGARSLSLTVV